MLLPPIQSRLGCFLYLVLRNDRVWASLNPQDRELVLAANSLHNNFRPDYASPKLYQGGLNFDSAENRLNSPVGKKLLSFLENVQPTSVIEVGPGSGFYTHSIVTFPSVRSFVAIDIVQSFLDFMQPRLEGLKLGKPDFDYKLLNGDFINMDFEPVDAIVLLSTIHHIPNRLDLLNWINKSLKPGGRCFVYEPSHYFPRVAHIVSKYLSSYSKASFRAKIENLSTHHFCTLEEFETICREVPMIKVNHYSFHSMDFPHFSRKVLNRFFTMLKIPRDEGGSIYVADRKSWLRFFSQRIFIVFRKD
jgi:SAM-dependent methyltransferase